MSLRHTIWIYCRSKLLLIWALDNVLFQTKCIDIVFCFCTKPHVVCPHIFFSSQKGLIFFFLFCTKTLWFWSSHAFLGQRVLIFFSSFARKPIFWVLTSIFFSIKNIDMFSYFAQTPTLWVLTSLSLRKHAYSNILKISPPKTENLSDKNSDIVHISAQNIVCRYSLEPPRRGGSNEYPQSMFLSRNKKNKVYPCKAQFYYIKVGFKGVKII